MGNIKSIVNNPSHRNFGRSAIVKRVQKLSGYPSKSVKVVEVKNPAKKKKRKMSALQLQYFGKKRKIKKRIKKTTGRKPVIKFIEVKNVAKKRRKRRVSESYVAPKRRRRRISNPAVYHKRKRRSYSVRRNPSSFAGIIDILINGAIAGVGAFGLLFVSDIIADKFLAAPATVADNAGKAKRNIATLALAIFGGWASMKFIKGKKGEAIAQGMVSGAVLRLSVNMLGLHVGLGETSSIDNVLDNLLKGETLLGNDYSGETLLGMDETLFGDEISEFEGYDEEID